MHQKQHNSGVIHTGVYYRPGSHKARFCVEGAKRLIRFCAERNIPLATRGKVIVATDERQLPWLDELLRRSTPPTPPPAPGTGRNRVITVHLWPKGPVALAGNKNARPPGTGSLAVPPFFRPARPALASETGTGTQSRSPT